MGRWLDDELAAVGRQLRSGALDRARCLGPMLAIDDDGVHALRDRHSLIPFDPENGPYKAAWLQQVHHAGGVLDAFGEPPARSEGSRVGKEWCRKGRTWVG